MIDPKWERGTVVFIKRNDPTSFYGYICPENGDGSRETHVWFGSKSCGNRTVRVDDVVLFERAQHQPKGPRVFQLCLAPETIEKRKLKTETEERNKS